VSLVTGCHPIWQDKQRTNKTKKSACSRNYAKGCILELVDSQYKKIVILAAVIKSEKVGHEIRPHDSVQTGVTCPRPGSYVIQNFEQPSALRCDIRSF